jgi:hypothetical protein
MIEPNAQHKILLREGLTSYLDALVAIEEFTRTIQENCRALLKRQIKPIQDASGLKFSDLSDYAEPTERELKNGPGIMRG